ncbi:MAG TPA: hypothetical protein VKZ49_19150 [Polyangiaceae bacterium]|nr:hypothetical protein [Polyangiaceae bacterium]
MADTAGGGLPASQAPSMQASAPLLGSPSSQVSFVEHSGSGPPPLTPAIPLMPALPPASPPPPALPSLPLPLEPASPPLPALPPPMPAPPLAVPAAPELPAPAPPVPQVAVSSQVLNSSVQAPSTSTLHSAVAKIPVG